MPRASGPSPDNRPCRIFTLYGLVNGFTVYRLTKFLFINAPELSLYAYLQRNNYLVCSLVDSPARYKRALTASSQEPQSVGLHRGIQLDEVLRVVTVEPQPVALLGLGGAAEEGTGHRLVAAVEVGAVEE